ncbi:MAG: hypothetical protein LBH00_01215 [Planctomycetaceae bacterium]|jgi:hypothetical protein|nr:hypothetical protein [Planctomycetaceae bacterium]
MVKYLPHFVVAVCSFLFTVSLFAQEQNKPHSAFEISDETVFTPVRPVVPLPDVVNALSRIPQNKEAVKMPELQQSEIFNEIHGRMSLILNEKICPDLQFVQKRTLLYQMNIPGSEHVWDCSFTPFKTGQWNVLFVCTREEFDYGIFIFFKSADEIKNADKIAGQYQSLFTKEFFDYSTSKEKEEKQDPLAGKIVHNGLTYAGRYMTPKPKLWIHETGFSVQSLLFMPYIFDRLALALQKDGWFEHERKQDEKKKKSAEAFTAYQKRMQEQKENSKTIVQTEAGRVKLIEMPASNDGKADFDTSYDFRQY